MLGLISWLPESQFWRFQYSHFYSCFLAELIRFQRPPRWILFFVFVFVYIYVATSHIKLFAWIANWLYFTTSTYINAHTYININTYILTYSHTRARTHARVRARTHTHMHTHTRTNTRTHTRKKFTTKKVIIPTWFRQESHLLA